MGGGNDNGNQLGLNAYMLAPTPGGGEGQNIKIYVLHTIFFLVLCALFIYDSDLNVIYINNLSDQPY